MAEFCKACSIELSNKDHGDLAGITSAKNKANGVAAIVICEGCGVIQVDQKGNCISKDCLKNKRSGHGMPYNWKGGDKPDDRGKGELFNHKRSLKKGVKNANRL